MKFIRKLLSVLLAQVLILTYLSAVALTAFADDSVAEAADTSYATRLWSVNDAAEGTVGSRSSNSSRDDARGVIKAGKGMIGEDGQASVAFGYDVYTIYTGGSSSQTETVTLDSTALSGAGFDTTATVRSETDLLWFWVNSDMDAIRRLQHTVNGKSFMAQKQYFWTIAADENGKPQMVKVVFEDEVTGNGVSLRSHSTWARLKFQPQFSGWVGIPISTYKSDGVSIAAGDTISKFTFFFGWSADNDPGNGTNERKPSTFYFDEFWLTSQDTMPDLTDAQLLYRAAAPTTHQSLVWTADEVAPVVINANNASSGRNTAKISVAADVGLNGTQALKYELVTAGNDRTHTWTCKTPATYGLRTGVQATADSDVIWYWAHADCSTKQRLQLALSGETLAPVSGNYIYTIVENSEGKPELSKIYYAASDNADAPVDYVRHSSTQAQVLFDPGWSGWIGVPINMLTDGTVKAGSSITSIAVLLLQKTADGDAYADQKVGDAIILDEFWMTTEGLMPNLSDELLLYTAEDASQTPDPEPEPEPEPEPHQTMVWNQENNGVELNIIGTRDNRNSSSMSVAAGRGVAGSKALKYEATTAGAITTAATESAPYARSITQTISGLTWNTYGGTDVKVSATDDIFWLWIDADLSTKQRFTFQLMGTDVKIQDAGETYIYTIVDQNGTAAIQKVLYSKDAAFPSDPVEGIDLINSNPSSNSSTSAQIRIDPNYSGWIGIPLNMLNTVPTAGSELTKFTLLLNQYTYDDPIEAQQVGDAVYMDEFWLTSAGLMPNLPDDQLLYQGQRELAFKSASLVIENGISVNFKADATLFGRGGFTEPYAVFTLGGITTKVTDYTVEKGNYVFRLKNIRPDWMGDTITATLHASDNGTDITSEAVSYSVAQYCYNKLTKSYPQGTAQDKLATLLTDILHYGAAAQVYANYKTDDLVTNALAGTPWQDWGTKEDRQLQDILTLAQDVDTPAVQWTGTALFLREQVRIRFRISTALTEALTLKGFADGKQILSVGFEDFVATSGGYYIFVDTLTALQMSQAVEYAVFAGDTQVSQTLTYSAETYAAKAVAANTDVKLADMMKAMIRYGDAARAYVGSDPVLKDDDTYNLLFIGNSYTYYNQMPESIFAQIAESAGYHVDVTRITKGGESLTNHANPTTETGAKIEAALTGSKKYDYVILQEQSSRPAKDADRVLFYDAVRNLSERIRAAGAEPILYETWGRKTGHSVLEENGWTNETMTWRLAAAYRAIGAELDIEVAYAGLAMFDVYTQGGIELYDSDKTHPSYAGSYLAAMTIFAQIFRVDPTTVAYNGALDAAVAQVLKQAAKDAVFNTPQIPAEYVITSEGITAK